MSSEREEMTVASTYRKKSFKKILFIIGCLIASIIAAIYDKYFLSGVVDFQAMIISHLIEKGFFKQGNPRLLAIEFYGPFYLMIAAYDTEKDNAGFKELMREHVKSFGKSHAVFVEE